MKTKRLRSATLVAAAIAATLAFPALASAWTVTVHVHGAGKVVETTARALMDCTTASNVSESTVTDCVAGTPSGVYNSLDIINLQAQVPQTYFDRGWRFLKWVDSNAGGGQINCDPQDQSGDHFSVNCQFQIFENLQTNLYLDDTFGPNATAITSGLPANPTRTTSAAFGFNASDDPDANFDCKLDRPGQPGSYAACGSSSDKSEAYSNLTTNGTYTFSVRGVDPSGNVDVSPASYSWVVDTVPPTVTIGGSPANGATTDSPTAAFAVASTEAATPSCTIDGQATGCGTEKTGLAPGSHTFAAQATDAAGNTGSASRSWTVVTPETTITSGPAPGSISGSSVSFGFIASPSAECTLDGSAWSACSSPQGYVLAGGSHTFSVRAKNGSNVDPTPATVTWIVDGDSDGSIVPQDCNDSDSATHPGATDTPGDGIDQDCSGTDAQQPTIAGGTSGAQQTTTAGGTSDALTPTLQAAPALPQPAALPATVAHKLVIARRGTIFKRLIVRKLPGGSKVSVACKGSTCPRKSFSKSASSELSLKPFMGKLLKPKTRLAITIKAPGFGTKTVTYVIRAGKKPKVTVG